MSPRRASRGPVVRILAGRWKGRRLPGPPSARPTSGRARQALFDIVAGRLPGARVLDLFAGTGAVGLEAVSRGASSAVLVESDPGPLASTLERMGAETAEVRLIARPAAAAVEELRRTGERFDVVFADPPYGAGSGHRDLAGVAGILDAGGVLVLQQDRSLEAPSMPGLVLKARRPYGRNVFLFFGML